MVSGMEDEIGYTIIQRLDALVKLTAMSTLDGKPFRERVLVLSNVGFQPKEIADILGKTPNHIRVTLHHLRKEGKV
jgi:DNA-directed RNA polymerase specialized sigma24 family protein